MGFLRMKESYYVKAGRIRIFDIRQRDFWGIKKGMIMLKLDILVHLTQDLRNFLVGYKASPVLTK